MRTLITGATGLIGSALAETLTAHKFEVYRLVRSAPQPLPRDIRWDPAAGQIRAPELEGFEAVIHLAGENLVAGRWSEAKKQRIRQSRVEGTQLLSETLARLRRPPRVLVSASAIGYYGDRGEEEVDESSPAGAGFLADVCRQWEAAVEPAVAAGIRVVLLRTGIVLARHGGALAKMLPIFRLGLGGALGSGRQYMSWIALDDELEAIEYLLINDAVSGPVNLTAPQPVANRQFARTLGRVLRRPALLPVPAAVLRLAVGPMADEALLAGARVMPRRLLAAGYRFGDPELEPALRHLLAPRSPLADPR